MENSSYDIRYDPLYDLQWDELIDKIIDGDVIPVIGSGVLVEGTTPEALILDKLRRDLHISTDISSFSELVCDGNYLRSFRNKKDVLYALVNHLFSSPSFVNTIPCTTSILQSLLSIRELPFVITTSVTPIVETTMRGIWGDELRVMKFNNDPRHCADIRDALDFRKPTVYYMFGKLGDGPHKYVLTDIDMLQFCSSWLSDGIHPKNLCDELRGKYLLMLGNNYSDWLFRFIWYSMRKQNMSEGMLIHEEQMPQSFIDFLVRVDAFIQRDPQSAVAHIVDCLSERLRMYECTKFSRPMCNADIFISYSRRDALLAEQLYSLLSARGKRVWLDKEDISSGGMFMDEINRAIDTAQYFVPILSDNITMEKNSPHVYRTEWHRASAVAISLGRTFIIPIAPVGFDFDKASIPEHIQRHNAISYSDISSLDDVAEKIIHTMNRS